MDCFVLPNDEISGELIHFKPNKALDFRKFAEPGLFTSLDKLLDRTPSGDETPRTSLRMVIGRLKDDKRQYYSLKAMDEYSKESPEAEIWALVNSLYEKWLKHKGVTK